MRHQFKPGDEAREAALSKKRKCSGGRPKRMKVCPHCRAIFDTHSEANAHQCPANGYKFFRSENS